MKTGKIVKWNVTPGEEVVCGDVLFELSTEQLTEDVEQGEIVMQVESQEDGWLARVLIEAGDAEIAVGAPLAYVCDDQTDIPAFRSLTGEGKDTGRMFTWQAFTKSKVFAECGGSSESSAKAQEDLDHLNYKPVQRGTEQQ